jgi:DNA-binding Lrp family transcriptional regulator
MKDAQPMESIDVTDFTILYMVQQHDSPPWKNKIHGWITDNGEHLPLADGVSVQTVGRRVDDLVQDGWLETVIVSPDNIKRDLIIAFRLTKDGMDTITAKREDLLKQTVRRHIFGDETETNISKHAVITLILHKFEWADSFRENLHSQYSMEELATFLAMTYIDEEATDLLDSDVEQFRDVIARYNDMADTLLREVEDTTLS